MGIILKAIPKKREFLKRCLLILIFIIYSISAQAAPFLVSDAVESGEWDHIEVVIGEEAPDLVDPEILEDETIRLKYNLYGLSAGTYDGTVRSEKEGQYSEYAYFILNVAENGDITITNVEYLTSIGNSISSIVENPPYEVLISYGFFSASIIEYPPIEVLTSVGIFSASIIEGPEFNFGFGVNIYGGSIN